MLSKTIRDQEMVDGAYATREIALEYVPRPREQLQVGEVVIPHGNILFNSRHKPSWRFALECWDTYLGLWEDLGLIKLGYPDLLIGKAMVDQAEINRWISYELKPLPFEQFYNKGLANGCRIDHLNLHFDQTIFCGIKLAFTGVRSPRKYGNLNSDPRRSAHQVPLHRRYIGNRPANRMIQRIKRKINKCLKQVPPVDFIEALSETETQFLVERGLGGRRVTITALDRLEPEL